MRLWPPTRVAARGGSCASVQFDRGDGVGVADFMLAAYDSQSRSRPGVDPGVRGDWYPLMILAFWNLFPVASTSSQPPLSHTLSGIGML